SARIAGGFQMRGNLQIKRPVRVNERVRQQDRVRRGFKLADGIGGVGQAERELVRVQRGQGRGGGLSGGDAPVAVGAGIFRGGRTVAGSVGGTFVQGGIRCQPAAVLPKQPHTRRRQQAQDQNYMTAFHNFITT